MVTNLLPEDWKQEIRDLGDDLGQSDRWQFSFTDEGRPVTNFIRVRAKLYSKGDGSFLGIGVERRVNVLVTASVRTFPLKSR